MRKTAPAQFLFGILVALSIYAGYYYWGTTRSPEVIFNTVWGSINTASIDTDFVEYFKRHRELHKRLQQENFKEKKIASTSSFVEYFTNGKMVGGKIMEYYENRVMELKRLNPSKDSKPLLDAAIDFYGAMDNIFKNDFLHVAEMVDAGVPDEEINRYLVELTINKKAEISEKYDALFEHLTAWGDTHGIKYTVH